MTGWKRLESLEVVLVRKTEVVLVQKTEVDGSELAYLAGLCDTRSARSRGGAKDNPPTAAARLSGR